MLNLRPIRFAENTVIHRPCRCLTNSGYRLLFLLCCCCSFTVHSQEIRLANNGKTDYRIIIPKAFTPDERYAARVLRDYLLKIAQVNLIIYNDDQTETDEEILVGNTNRTYGKYPVLYAPGLRPQAYWIKTCGKKLVLLGGNDGGIINAVYSFLEDHLECRFFTPWVEDIPKKQLISLKNIDDLQVPASEIRIVHGNYFEDEAFRRKRKLHHVETFWGAKEDDRYFVHTFHKLVPEDIYFDPHPEYFSMINGKRVPWGQLCLSNPALVQIAVNHLREVMARYPERKHWSVSQNDNYYACDCPACKAIDEEEGSPAGLLLRFVNQIADSFPDKVITTLAYQYTRKPPLHTRPRPNVMITLCTIELNRSIPIEKDPGSADFREDIAGWNRISDHIMLWDYEVQFTNYLCPFPLFHTLQPNLQFFIRHDAKAHFQQCNLERGLEFAELKGYLLSKLLWNPNIPSDSVINEFMEGYYGDAAPYIHSYFNLLHNEAILSGDRLDIYGSPVWHAQSFLSKEKMEQYNALFDKAELMVAFKPEYLRRVRVARLPIQYATLEIARTDLFGERGWYIKRGAKFVMKKQMKELLDGFHERCRSENIKYLNENGLTVETYYQNTLRFIQVQTEGNLAFQKAVVCDPLPARKYTHKGPSVLTDGVRGTEDYKIHWLGWEGLDPRITVDLGKADTIKEITVSTLQDPKSWILHPLFMNCYLSEDGEHFTKAGTRTVSSDPEQETIIKEFNFSLKPVKARYIRLFVTATKSLPSWHPYKGNKSWVFIDEITIR
ncbi:MAG TPA: DUF4838 domain-containing protein [Bacteroidales bacterium]|nr:DUF4838 domain-containing protein [Bacteroidales bacterium]HSA43065.1 DUF4838 domain-containing protein [Bacteroidales bacterium]